jgi:transposase
VDASQRCSVERFAQTLSVVHDLLAAPQRVDGGRYLGTSLGSTGATTRSPRARKTRRIVCRRHVFLGKKGGEKVGKTKRGKGTKIMVLTDAEGLPLGEDTASASPHEVTLIEPLLEKRVLREKPRRLIYDEAADSDPLRERLKRRGIELVCRHRRNRVKPPTQDGRKLRRFRRRWKVERSISWLQNFRRLITRFEYHAHLFHGFVQLACLIVVLGRF